MKMLKCEGSRKGAKNKRNKVGNRDAPALKKFPSSLVLGAMPGREPAQMENIVIHSLN